MYVYCLNKTWTIEEEHFLESPDIFKDYEKGKEAFKKKMEEILREDFNNDPEFMDMSSIRISTKQRMARTCSLKYTKRGGNVLITRCSNL